MIEMPEAANLARQLTKTIKGKKIKKVTAGFSPHKFAWYHGDPADYNDQLRNKGIGKAVSHGGLVEVRADDAFLLFGDGVSLRFHAVGDPRPGKHQLLIEFEDDTAISASIQMYGGLWCFREGEFDNPYYEIAQTKPSPLSNEFDRTYFDGLIDVSDVQKLSAKAFLATEQRIPGLGNGVLQDILYSARIHPKRKVNTLTNREKSVLFRSVKSTLGKMTDEGGRDTEKDLFGEQGGYKTRLSKNTLGKPCPVCGEKVVKQAYMGGSIYFCPGCQKIAV
jgi:formamidopyrimidine-DNA glycosylase